MSRSAERDRIQPRTTGRSPTGSPRSWIGSARVSPFNLEAYAVAHPERAERLRGLVSAVGCLGRHGGLSGSGTSCDGDPMADEVVSLGDFRTVRVLGQGGMGVVYEAVQVSLNRRVALKILPAGSTADSRRLKRFQVEAQAAAFLHHAHIVPVFVVGSAGGVHYYAMQLIDGRTLAAVIADGEPSTPRAVADLGPEGRRGSPVRPRAGDHPPRRQAVQSPDRWLRRALGRRLRAGADRGRR